MTVLVVGAGPTGLTVAALLGQRGIACTVVEQRERPFALPRAVHLDDESMRVLQEVGVAAALPTRPALGLRLVDRRLRTLAQFDRAPGTGPFGYPRANMFSQPDLEALLRDRIASLPSVELREGVSLVGLRGGRASLSGGSADVEFSYLLGCDGAGSTVRQLAGLGWRDLGFEERWLVVDGRQRAPMGTWDGVFQVCDPTRPATFMQVGRDTFRWEFRLHDGETADSVDLGALLSPWQVDDDLDVLRRAEYTFRAGVAKSWRRGNVLLLGDAAHQTPPFIGQGLGMGLRDASNLAWKLAGHPHLLDTYQQEREPHVTGLIRKAIVVGWALTGGQDAAAKVRRRALGLSLRAPRLMAAALDRPTSGVRRGTLVARGPLAGRAIPQPSTDFDAELGNGFALVLTHRPTPAVVAVAEALGAHHVAAPAAVADWMRRAGATAALVRPDRVVIAAADRRGRLSREARRAAAAYGQTMGASRNELKQYDDLADQWWEPRGDFAMLTWISAARVRHLPPAGGMLLDMACGGGLLAPFVKGWTHIGVDLSLPSLRHAQAHGVRVAQADVLRLPFADSAFDVVVAGEILEHVDDLAGVVREACRVLRPGGTLVIDTIARTWWGRFSSITVAERAPAGPPKLLHDHRLFVDREELLALASAGGVELTLNGLRPSFTDYLLWLRGRRSSVRMLTTRSTAGLFQGAGMKA